MPDPAPTRARIRWAGAVLCGSMLLTAVAAARPSAATAQAARAEAGGEPSTGVSLAELEALGWPGRYERGPETVEIIWDGGLLLVLGGISVPGDGGWHETVSTFSVRHRVTWISEGGRIRFEEQHNRGAHWVYEFVLEGDELLKIVPAGTRQNAEPAVQRRYRRVTHSP